MVVLVSLHRLTTSTDQFFFIVLKLYTLVVDSHNATRIAVFVGVLSITARRQAWHERLKQVVVSSMTVIN